MSTTLATEKLMEALKKRNVPSIVVWNRLEGRPRTDNFDRSMKAEIRDALWMLTRQWQMGEFEADDAGAPIDAKVHYFSSLLNKYQANASSVQIFDDGVPLETKVEQQRIPFKFQTGPISLDLRLQMGRQWLQMIKSLGNFESLFHAKYPVILPDPELEANANICAHSEVWSRISAVAGRSMDGYELIRYLKEDPAHASHDGIAVDPALHADFDQKAAKFIHWFDWLYYQPENPADNAWKPPQLEYAFKCAAPNEAGETVFTADEYYHGHLDWHSVDIEENSDGLGEVAGGALPVVRNTQTLSFIPNQVTFEGMPSTRWWKFEDSRTSFGQVDPSTTDLATLLLIEFGLIYANDWFLLPLQLPVGTVCQIKGLAVTNSFGERFWVEPAGKSRNSDWNRWSMFSLSVKDSDVTRDNLSILIPSVPGIQEGPPLEEIYLIRDEVANMVWGIEKTIPMPDGGWMPGREAAREYSGYLQKLINQKIDSGVIAPEANDYAADIFYKTMNTVPENWIPFIPIHQPGSNREIQLQRAALPRMLKNDPNPPVKVTPRTDLLRFGLDHEPAQPYFVFEEEVPRTGIAVSQSFQRTRWMNGRVFVWIGRRKRIGRGEGASGLAFDQILPVNSND